MKYILVSFKKGLTLLHYRRKNKQNNLRGLSKRTIPTKRPPLVGEVSANLCG
jgi:hypothetical protein